VSELSPAQIEQRREARTTDGAKSEAQIVPVARAQPQEPEPLRAVRVGLVEASDHRVRRDGVRVKGGPIVWRRPTGGDTHR
jgi:hypothetical protein